MLQRHDAMTKRSLKWRYKEYKSTKLEGNGTATGEASRSDNAADGQSLPRLSWKEACLRCKELELDCYACVGQACIACQSAGGEDEYYRHGCLRGDLLDIISSRIPDMPGLGSDEWLFPTASGAFFEIRMKYPDDERRRIRDLDEFVATEDTIATRIQAITTFIQQFRNINNRWTNCYELTTVKIIEACVSIQQMMLEESRQSWSPLGDRNTIIATSLRALALAHEIFELDGNLPWRMKDVFHQSSFRSKKLECDAPTITISRVKKVPKRFDSKERKLPALVREMHRVTQKMLLRPQAKDLPTILCVLCIMKLVQNCLEPMNDFFDAFCAKEFKTAWFSYCLVFHEMARDYHPLVYHWDKSNYEELAGEDSMPVTYFKSFRTIWVEDDFAEGCGHMLFHRGLENFIMGDIID
ncbi:hypothetical protein EG329_013744 [Mollisiaceae sp. DMI_Dod_QoI]|nr:hypothetical protein EG329_013744 [Helotiales sp. DMI_Dod_QoI]